MTPFFAPGPNPYGPPRIVLGGVGPRMTEVAGEVADGFMIHPFSTAKFMRETTLPALERGATRAGRTLADIEIAFPVMIVAAENDEQLAAGLAAMRPRERNALLLYALADLSYAEVAVALDVPVGTVRTWLHRARATAQRELGTAEADTSSLATTGVDLNG